MPCGDCSQLVLQLFSIAGVHWSIMANASVVIKWFPAKGEYVSVLTIDTFLYFWPPPGSSTHASSLPFATDPFQFIRSSVDDEDRHVFVFSPTRFPAVGEGKSHAKAAKGTTVSVGEKCRNQQRARRHISGLLPADEAASVPGNKQHFPMNRRETKVRNLADV